jgi:hypothetical protein
MNALLVKDEALRSQALEQYEVLNTAADPVLDDIVRLAAQLCDTPIAFICLVGPDRLWLKSRVGLDASELAVGCLPCETTIQGDTYVRSSGRATGPGLRTRWNPA